MATSVSQTKSAELEALNADVKRIAQHQAAGRHGAAGEKIDRLLQTYEGHPRLMHYKGLNLILAGQRKEGLALLEQVVSHESADVMAWVDYGAILAQGGDLDAAIEKFQGAVEMAPNYALAQANLGAALVLKEKYGRAIEHLEKALELDGQILDVHTNLAKAYMRTHRFQQAIDVSYKALSIDPKSVTAHIDLAAALFRIERHDAAEHHARRAIELAPSAAEAWLHLGSTLGASGRLGEAAEALLKIAAQPPVGISALARLVHMRTTRTGSPELELLTQYAKRLDNLQPEQQVSIHFALGKAFDDLGDYPAAIEHFNAGNKINADLHPFDAKGNIERSERMRELTTPEFMARCGGGGLSDLAPIFICGMPRSGTTLMDQMFSRHADVQAGGELNGVNRALARNAPIRAVLEREKDASDLSTDDFSRLGEDYIAYLHAEGLKAEYVSDKLPGNYLYIGLMAMALPRAKFLIMRRHPMDCLFSNYMQHFGQNQPFSSDFGNLASVYNQFDLMAKHWVALLPDRVREVNYEDVVADPEGQMRSILDFVGLEWSDDILDHTASTHQVNTASVAQVRQPIYNSAVARWRRYGPRLQGLALALRDHLSVEELRAAGVTQDM
ncbi:MAG: sulfotransferase [Roseovarius sp.]|nr:sulfotransferase [Roseovarius sp.]